MSTSGLLRLSITGVFGVLALSAALHFGAGVDLAPHLGFLPDCAFRAATGLPCPGCGMTTALLLLSQLRVGEALASHPAAPALLAAMGVALVAPGATLGRHRDAVGTAALGGVLCLWIARLSAG